MCMCLVANNLAGLLASLLEHQPGELYSVADFKWVCGVKETFSASVKTSKLDARARH